MVQEIRPNLFLIEVPLPDSPLKSLNSYVVRTSDRNLVIDTGLNRKECYTALTDGLKHLNVDLAQTDFFITHLHADHFGLVSELKTETSRIFFNRPDAEIIESWGGWEPMVESAAQNGFPENELRNAIDNHPGYKFGSQWVPELNIIADGDDIVYGDYHFQCIQTPGHTLGHMCLYEADQKIFVAGDHILIDITPNIQCWSDVQDPLGLYLQSLNRVAQLEIELLLPGHRRLVVDPTARITELKDHHHARCLEILSILDDRQHSAYTVASRMHWDIKCDTWEEFPVAQKWFATGEAIAHLRYLEENQKVRRTTDQGHILFSPNGASK